MPIRALLFDIGNVLLRFDFSRAMRRLTAESDVADLSDALGRIDAIKLRYEDGTIDRASFLRESREALGYRGTDADFIHAWEDIFELNEPMAALVERLAATHPLYLLSNTNCIHRDYFLRRWPVFAHFRGGTYSDLARASKPGRAIYDIACREHALDPATTFFIDDLLPNIETARALGFQAHHYHHERHGELLHAIAEAHGA